MHAGFRQPGKTRHVKSYHHLERVCNSLRKRQKFHKLTEAPGSLPRTVVYGQVQLSYKGLSFLGPFRTRLNLEIQPAVTGTGQAEGFAPSRRHLGAGTAMGRPPLVAVVTGTARGCLLRLRAMNYSCLHLPTLACRSGSANEAIHFVLCLREKLAGLMRVICDDKTWAR